MHLRDFKILKEQDGIVYFQNGTYNTTNGNNKYKSKELPFFLKKLNNIHKSSSKDIVHWFTLIYGITLLFMAISSFWMFKPKTKLFWRGIFFAFTGFVIAVILLFL